jgi:putative sigma-54 modulation protein
MQLAVTFRHMDATPALKEYAREKVDRINKYFPDPIKAHVVLSTDRGFNHVADVMITLHSGFVIKGQETTEDMYSSIDLVMAKIERQVRRYKEKLQDRRPMEGRVAREVSHAVLAEPEKEVAAVPAAAAQRFNVVSERKFVAQPLNVEEAIMQMNLLGDDFLVFENADTHHVNVVYHRKDGSYGLIETGNGAAAA